MHSLQLHPRSICLSAAVVLASVAVGCATTPKLMPTPHLYARAGLPLFEDLARELESTDMNVFYVTDRAAEVDASGVSTYGHERSASVAFGTARIRIHSDSWEEVVAYSTGDASGSPKLTVETIDERGRLPATPYLYRLDQPDRLELDPEVVAERAESLAHARRELGQYLALTPRKEVFLFVHGVGNSFEDAVLATAETWHFLGREGVPMAYTWPAGRGGLFFYAYDRESGEFTVFHLKQLFEVLATLPEVEKVHVLAHSRGTDVVMSALRELVIETRAAGRSPRDYYKIENVILLAPDIDFGVVMQRLVAEALGPAFGRITVYANADDNAISAASLLFDSRLRLGALHASKLDDDQRKSLGQIANLDIISYRGGIGGAFGHAYFRENPAVSSDVLARLRYGWLPGEGLRKDLRQVGEAASNFWVIEDDYLSSPSSDAALKTP